MTATLDPGGYRDITTTLFPPSLTNDASIALDALQGLFGVGGGATAIFNGKRVVHWEPSGLLTRCVKGQVEGVWAPLSIHPEQIARWRAGIEAAVSPIGYSRIKRLLLCGIPIAHHWVCERAGISLYPPPQGSPRAPMFVATHPAILSVDVERASDLSITSLLGARRLEWWSQVLNVATYLRCNHTIRGQSGWAWNRTTQRQSLWSDLTYFTPELVNPEKLTPPSGTTNGVWKNDFDYYVGFQSSEDGAATLPESLDETLVAADSLPPEHKLTLRRASRLIQAADEASASSSSMAFIALASAIETLSKNWSPQLRPTAGFKQFLSDMVPCYRNFQDAATQLYRLRCGLVHEGLVFADDWVDRPEDDDSQESQSLFILSFIARIATVNWIRSRAGRSKIPSKHE